ncbi:MAG: NAD kinase [Bacteroidetes bacterium GWE2_29_8]|nr:MAG: NAD kinase [Bacteroidetes bacterium GWE2_29_8]OFY19154.1 MAG: NAD kinase [Bacteroidetes bacterium GWF2_29_10]
MSIAIYGRINDRKNIVYLSNILDVLRKNKKNFIIHKDLFDFANDILCFSSSTVIFDKNTNLEKDNIEFFISMGGDGTILEAVSYVRNNDIPIVGINLGRLGFLSSIPKEDIDEALNELLKGNGIIEKRSLLSLITKENIFKNENYALNEIVVQKTDSSSMITINAFVDDEYLNSYWADGLIISTPTGSTGYSLSCGGPIIYPESKALIITPIASHNLTVRPIIIPDDKMIKLVPEGRNNNFLIGLDSRNKTLKKSTEIIIQKANFQVSFLTPKDNSYFKTLRNKLMWGNDKRN